MDGKKTGKTETLPELRECLLGLTQKKRAERSCAKSGGGNPSFEACA
jgi:hypothetical protein